jgi:hypothetical protein
MCDGTSQGRWPVGRCSKAFCSSTLFGFGAVVTVTSAASCVGAGTELGVEVDGLEGERVERDPERFIGDSVDEGMVSERFFGRPRSMIDAPDSDS